MAYLAYLRYWEAPAYAKFLHYPHALYFLDQLQRPEVRAGGVKGVLTGRGTISA